MKSTSSFIQIIIIFSCIQAVNAAGPEQRMRILQPPINVPATKFFDGSRQITLDSFKGNFVVVNFWASWCPPCIYEMPSLDRLTEKLSQDNFMVIAISQDEGGATQVKPLLKKLNIKNLHILYDMKKKAFRDFAIPGLPITILLSPEGKILARLEGSAEWDKGPLFGQIQKIITLGK